MTAAQIPLLTALLAAIASLLWPALAIGALLIFRGPVMRALNRVTDSGGTVEVFGVKVNVGKATEEQQVMIEDLQKQVQALRDRVGIDAPAGAARGAADKALAPERRRNPRILWVDDVPDNNAVLVASLRNRGFHIEQALSTEDAEERFEGGSFDIVISDMGRGPDREAGLTLTKDLRGRGADMPILIFCSNKAAAVFREAALAAGADLITDSATILMEALMKLKAPQ